MRVLVCVLVVVGLASADPPVALDKDSFAEAIASGKPYFVKFYAPWCGHCKRLAPTWDELADKFTGTDIVTIAKVDCTVETAVCAENGVRGYPTLKLFGASEEAESYQGSRDLQSLFQFVTDKLTGEKPPVEEKEEVKREADAGEEEGEGEGDSLEVERDENDLLHLTDKNFNSFINSRQGIQFVKFYAPWCGHCKRLAPTWDKLALHFQGDQTVDIAKVDCTVEKSTCQHYGVKGYPTLLLLADGIVLQKYSGSRTLEDLVQFVEDNRIE